MPINELETPALLGTRTARLARIVLDRPYTSTSAFTGVLATPISSLSQISLGVVQTQSVTNATFVTGYSSQLGTPNSNMGYVVLGKSPEITISRITSQAGTSNSYLGNVQLGLGVYEASDTSSFFASHEALFGQIMFAEGSTSTPPSNAAAFLTCECSFMTDHISLKINPSITATAISSKSVSASLQSRSQWAAFGLVTKNASALLVDNSIIVVNNPPLVTCASVCTITPNAIAIHQAVSPTQLQSRVAVTAVAATFGTVTATLSSVASNVFNARVFNDNYVSGVVQCSFNAVGARIVSALTSGFFGPNLRTESRIIAVANTSQSATALCASTSSLFYNIAGQALLSCTPSISPNPICLYLSPSSICGVSSTVVARPGNFARATILSSSTCTVFPFTTAVSNSNLFAVSTIPPINWMISLGAIVTLESRTVFTASAKNDVQVSTNLVSSSSIVAGPTVFGVSLLQGESGVTAVVNVSAVTGALIRSRTVILAIPKHIKKRIVDCDKRRFKCDQECIKPITLNNGIIPSSVVCAYKNKIKKIRSEHVAPNLQLPGMIKKDRLPANYDYNIKRANTFKRLDSV